tara:strand:- start:196 stop:348 length:153 start_codon:yes stop_codon:yes gene_type:complete
MKHDDIAVGFGGGTAPVWLPEIAALNQVVGLMVGLLSIAYLLAKLWRLHK